MRVLPAALVPALLLAVVPSEGSPFHGPKLVVLALGALLAAALALPREGDARLERWLLAGAAAIAISAALGGQASAGGIVLAISAALTVWAFARVKIDRALLGQSVAASGALLAAVVLLQWAGHDPFRAAGLTPVGEGARLRLYGTLGNPDFVAGALGVTCLWTLGEAWVTRRVGFGVLAAVQLVAWAATGSLASLLFLGAAGLALLLRSSSRRAVFVGGLVACALVLLAGARARGPARALEGRLYLWKVAAPHLLDAPWVGGGPASVERRWSGWEAAYDAAHPGDAARFGGEQLHVHEDLLELALDLGVPGALVWLLIVALACARAFRSREPRDRIVLAALAGLLARALVDFPLHRPAELGLFCILVALAIQARLTKETA